MTTEPKSTQPNAVPLQAVPSEQLNVETLIRLAGPYFQEYQRHQLQVEQARAAHEAQLAELQKEVDLRRLDRDHTFRLWTYGFQALVVLLTLGSTIAVGLYAPAPFITPYFTLISVLLTAVFVNKRHRQVFVDRPAVASGKASQEDEAE